MFTGAVISFRGRGRRRSDPTLASPPARDAYAEARVQTATRLATSDWYADRLTAGCLLAAEAGDQQIDAVLRQLLLDPDDTAVSSATAEALLQRHDVVGMALALEGWRDADDHSRAHLGDEFLDVCNDPDGDRTTFHAELLAVRAALPQLAEVADEVAAWLGFDTGPAPRSNA